MLYIFLGQLLSAIILDRKSIIIEYFYIQLQTLEMIS